jgi:hypothetical protein
MSKMKCNDQRKIQGDLAWMQNPIQQSKVMIGHQLRKSGTNILNRKWRCRHYSSQTIANQHWLIGGDGNLSSLLKWTFTCPFLSPSIPHHPFTLLPFSTLSVHPLISFVPFPSPSQSLPFTVLPLPPPLLEGYRDIIPRDFMQEWMLAGKFQSMFGAKSSSLMHQVLCS